MPRAIRPLPLACRHCLGTHDGELAISWEQKHKGNGGGAVCLRWVEHCKSEHASSGTQMGTVAVETMRAGRLEPQGDDLNSVPINDLEGRSCTRQHSCISIQPGSNAGDYRARKSAIGYQ